MNFPVVISPFIVVAVVFMPSGMKSSLLGLVAPRLHVQMLMKSLIKGEMFPFF